MPIIKLKIISDSGYTLLTADSGEFCSMVYSSEYKEGDRICIETDTPGSFWVIQLDDALPPAVVYLTEKEYSYYIPFGERRRVCSPKAFSGDYHLISARKAIDEEIYSCRNIAFNPYDQNGIEGSYPHASANIETRGEAVFAARNTIDGVFANNSHGEYPYQSWGINRRADAEMKIDFGVEVEISTLRITLRADFPHDNYWTKGKVVFSDGTEMELNFEKTANPQSFSFEPKTIKWLVIKDLIKSDEPSPFPALTQVEAFGKVVKK